VTSERQKAANQSNEHHSTSTCLSVSVPMALAVTDHGNLSRSYRQRRIVPDGLCCCGCRHGAAAAFAR
jgi:hypothetical protein